MIKCKTNSKNQCTKNYDIRKLKFIENKGKQLARWKVQLREQNTLPERARCRCEEILQ